MRQEECAGRPPTSFPSEIPNDYRDPNTGTPTEAEAVYSKAGAVDFYKNLALSVINGGYGHPAEELLHFDQVGMVPANWPYLVPIFSGAKAALGANKYLSLNIGGWNSFAPLSWISHSTAISNIASMCHYFGSERTPVMGDLPIEKGLYVDNYKVIINNFRTLMIGGCGPELVPQLHLVLDQLFPQYEIESVTYIDTPGADMNYFGMESRMPPYGRTISTKPNDHKLLLRFTTTCHSCNPTIGCNPVKRFKIDNAGVANWPRDKWTAWPKQPSGGQEPREMYVFRSDKNLPTWKTDLGGASFSWNSLVGKKFYDTSYYERMQAATILFAAPNMSAPGGVHHSVGRFHPGHMSTNLGFPNMDWRRWGAILGEPIDSTPTYVPASGQIMLDHVYRRFTNFVFHYYPKEQRFYLEH